jgi:hypothetical protein
MLEKVIGSAARRLAGGSPDGAEIARPVRCLVSVDRPFPSAEFFDAPVARLCMNLNEHEGVVYFHKESFDRLVRLALFRELYLGRGAAETAAPRGEKLIGTLSRTAGLLDRAAAGSGYRFDRFLRYLQSDEFLTLSAGPVPAPPRPQHGP